MSTKYTPAQVTFLADTLARMKREILADVHAGVVPSRIQTFADLDDYVDANEYGGVCEESDATGLKGLDLVASVFPDPPGSPDYGTMNSQFGMTALSDLQDMAHAWICDASPSGYRQCLQHGIPS